MALHHALRELVDRLGAGVLDDADDLRAALDDFLDEGDATEAEIRLLAETVREGGPARLRGLLDNGAHAQDAVRAVGAVVSGRVGADERGARWAVAALGHALGCVADCVAASSYAEWRSGIATRTAAPVPLPDAAPAPPPESPISPPPAPAPGPAPAPASLPPATAPVPSTAIQPDDHRAPTPGRRRRRALPALLVVLVLAAAGLGGWRVLAGDDPGAADEGASGRSTGDPGDAASDSVTSEAPDTGETGDDGGPGDTGNGTDAGPAYVAFSSRSGGTARVQVLDLGSGSTRPVAADGEATQPSVSADGRTVAFVLDTGSGKRLAISTGAGAPRVLDVGREPSDPAISPDGSAVAFVTETAGGKDVSVLALDGTAPRVVAGGSADELDPTWSHDGTLIGYVLTGSSDDSIVLVNADSGNEVSRTPATGHASSPALSPSAIRVAYVTRVQGNAEVVVTDVGTSGSPVNVSQSGDTEAGVLWLADGRLVTSAAARGLVAITEESPSPEVVTSGTGDSL